jgi:hypothetical protein
VPPDCPVTQRSNDSLRANGRLCRGTVPNSTAQKSEVTGRSDVTPDCPVQQKDKRLLSLGLSSLLPILISKYLKS